MNLDIDTEISKKRKRLCRYGVLLALLCLLPLASPTVAVAHEGPPFPIIVDHEVGPYLVSVWTDPDIGIGTFFVVFEPNPEVQNISMEIRSVEVGVEPVSGRLEEVLYPAETQRTRKGARYFAEVEFDQGEMWKVRVVIEGDGWSEELNSEVEATPDGSIGPIVILIYAFPFILVGFLWVRAIMVRRQGTEEE